MEAELYTPKIKLVDEETDLSTLKMERYDWDLEVNDKPYQVVRIPGYIHTLEYKFGREAANDLWAYPLGEEPTAENLIEYTVIEPVCWGIVFEPQNKVYYSHDEAEVRRIPKCFVTRNGKKFGDSCYSTESAQKLIQQFHEHPVNFESRNYEEDIVDRKVYWRSEPGVITTWISTQACVIIEPDGIGCFTVPPEFKDEPQDDETWIKTSIFDPHLWWFRED